MNHWFKINLGDAMLATVALDEMAGQLNSVYEKSGKLETMLAIYRHESFGLHCSLMVYLTADFQAIAQLEGAEKISYTPELDSGFLAGNKTKLD